MAANPNPNRISPALWRLWTDFHAHEPSALLGGIYAVKPGYHRHRDALPTSDYSRRDLVADRRGSGSKASAIDLTLPADKMRLYTNRLDVAARARDPRLYTARGPVLREFIGTKNSADVYCYVLVGGKPLGVGTDAGPDEGRDISHLWHIHLSVIRQFCEDWPALDGVLSVLRGESLATWRARTEGVFMALSEEDQDAMKWRIEGLTSGRTAVANGPTVGAPIVPNVKLGAIEQKVGLLASAVGSVDEAVAAGLRVEFDQIDAAQETVLASVRDAALLAAERDAVLLALVQQHADGTLDAEDVVRRLGEVLSGQAQA